MRKVIIGPIIKHFNGDGFKIIFTDIQQARIYKQKFKKILTQDKNKVEMIYRRYEKDKTKQ